MHRITTIIVLPVLCLTVGGCVTPTATGDQVANSVYASHRILRQMEEDLEPRLTQLNETVADLSTRVESSDQETRELQAILEENQVKLDAIQNRLAELADVVYKGLGVTPPQDFAAFQPDNSLNLGAPPSIERPSGIGMPIETEPSEGEGLVGAEIEPGDTGAEGAPPSSGDHATDYQAAQQSRANRDYETALRQFREYIKLYPTTESVHHAQFWIGQCYFDLKQYEAAVEEFEKLSKNYPTSPKVPLAMNQEAVALVKLGQTQRAVSLLEKLIENWPTDPTVVKAKANLERLKGQ
jgi:tol-pal system protein YbgF